MHAARNLSVAGRSDPGHPAQPWFRLSGHRLEAKTGNQNPSFTPTESATLFVVLLFKSNDVASLKSNLPR
jgi:hypothetical protein